METKYRCLLCHTPTSKDRYDSNKKCVRCGGHIEVLGEEHPQMNGMCFDCLSDEWGKIVEDFPMVSPQNF